MSQFPLRHLKNLSIGLASVLMSGLGTAPRAQNPPGAYSASWIGNTFGHGGDAKDPKAAWVQDYIDQMVVQPDGTCYTASDWDEAGRKFGVYKDGKVIGNEDHKIDSRQVTIQGKTWTIQGSQIVGPTVIADAGTPVALGVTPDNKLLVADDGPREQILFYDVKAVPRIIETFGVKGGIGEDFTARFDLPATINAPAYPKGKYAPGVYHPMKLWGLTGVGMDSRGRLFVSTSGGATGIRCFKKDSQDRWILDWIVENYCFVDSVDFDVASDGTQVYGVQERYAMDYNKSAPGSEWRLKAYTAIPKYHNDPRNILDVKAGHEHGLTSAFIRTVQGHRLLFAQGMTCQLINIFRFAPNSDVAIPSGLLMPQDHRIFDFRFTYFWPPNRPPIKSGTVFWRDLNGDGDYQKDEYANTKYPYAEGDWFDSKANIWQAGNPIICRHLSGFDARGNPFWDDKDAASYPLSGIGDFGRIQYQEDHDRMILITTHNRDLKGGEVYTVDHWSQGNRAARFVCKLGSPEPATFAVAGDYLFDGGWKTNARVWITDLRIGKVVGQFTVPDYMGGIRGTGWIDIGYGISAFQRHNGDYLVVVEDDFLGRDVLYRWLPGDHATKH